MTLIARKVGVELGGNQIVSSVDLNIGEGELVGILGPSGSGKSTLLMALSGFRPPTAGTVTLDGRDLNEHFESLKSEIGFVPQDDIVPTALTVERVLQYAAELRLADLDVEARRGRVDTVIRMLELGERRDLRVAKLSGGQRKRVNVGVELLTRPRLLLADEPTSGLDPALERSLTETFKKLTEDGNIVVVTTHIMTSLDLYDRLAVLVGGRIAYEGPPGSIKAYFEVDDYADIYHRLGERTPEQWHQRRQKGK